MDTIDTAKAETDVAVFALAVFLVAVYNLFSYRVTCSL